MAIQLDQWEYKESTDQIWKKCSLPQSIYSILMNEGKILNPYWMDQETKLTWVDDKSWWFRSTFEIDSTWFSFPQAELVLGGLDGYADIFLNQVKILSADNSFREWRIPCKDLLKENGNLLEIRFSSTSLIAETKYRMLPHLLPGGERVMVRKPQFSFGWDFAPKLQACAIRKKIFLEFPGLFEVSSFGVFTKKLENEVATLELDLKTKSILSGDGKIHLTMDKDSFSFDFNYPSGLHQQRFEFDIVNPKLWWPSGSGEPYLYDAKISITNADSLVQPIIRTVKAGIRTIELIQEPDDYGRSFYFKVNGLPIFAKGANYIPADAVELYHPNPDPWIKSLKESHFNMIRIWGGGTYEQDAFYSSCDRHGIMVWQDFMFACAMYPGDPEFLQNVAAETYEQVTRLSSHPCIALWCGNNENNEGWHRWGWQIGMSKKNKDRIWSDYQKLFNNILPELVKLHGNYHSYIESSPLYGRGDPKFKSDGDAHDWGIWHDGLPFEDFEHRVPRFMSEAGFQSFPDLSTLRKYLPEHELKLESEFLLSHQKHPKGQQTIQTYLARDYPKPTDLESFIYLSQLMQAEGMGKAILAHRKSKPYCMGTLYWQLNDCWPGISWSGMDYFGNWKALHHKVSHLFQPILCHLTIEDDLWKIGYTSDLIYEDSLFIQLSLRDFNGNEYFNWKTKLLAGYEQTQTVQSMQMADFLDQYRSIKWVGVLEWEYSGKKEQSIFFPQKCKDLELLKPNFNLTNFKKTSSGYKFLIQSDKFAKAVYFREQNGLRFFPNFIDLAPGESREIQIQTNQSAIGSDQIIVKSLYDYQNQP
ncbi:MAG: glycoside hydrolase family 2 protein [Saprospiraceae bacterium]|nr:glycoside hydrolase family 2 protein [Saprospiraceae bacterium]